MKKFGLFLLMLLLGITLLGCNDLGLTTINPTNIPTGELTTDNLTTKLPNGTDITEEVTFEDKIFVGNNEGCNESDNAIMVGGECIYMEDILSPQIVVTETEINVNYENGIELMDDLIADLSGSTGLAVVPREIYINQRDLNQERRSSLMNVSMTLEDEVTNNIIVKLKEDGFFEEVSFTDSTGYTVNINSNPLALEVFGDYTVIIFEVDFGYEDDQRNFDQRVYDSLYSGGIYLIHNESGKLFPTSDVNFVEETWIETQYDNQTIFTTANVNEPVTQEVMNYLYDEFGEPILDEFGEPTYEMIDEIILDEFGEEIIFEDGPIVTELQEFPLTETFLVLVTDEFGEPILDEFDQPIYDEVTEPVLDEFGEPVYYTEEVAVLDEFGQVIYQTDFEVEISVVVETEITKTNYRAEIQQGPLYELSRRFVERVMENYFNWNFYRMSNYSINYGFAESGDLIYYTDDKYNDVSDSNERYILRLSFDAETNELVLEEIMNITKAGFLQGDLILDPNTNIILYKNYGDQANIKAYSPEIGLKTIPDSDNFEIRIFPNDELFLVDRQTEYVESLGYSTTAIYSLNPDATLTKHYIELGEKEEVNMMEVNYYGFSAKIYDRDNNPINDNPYNYYLDIQIGIGDKFIDNAKLKIVSIGDLDSSRPLCTDENGCPADIIYSFYVGEEYIWDGYRTINYYPGDTPPPFHMSYQLFDDSTTYYQDEYVETPIVCDNDDLGCQNNIALYVSIGDNNYSLDKQLIVNAGEQLIDRFVIKEENNIQYEYSKTEYGGLCEFSQCQTNVKIDVYDLDGDLFASEHRSMTYLLGETIPLVIEFRMSVNSTLTEGSVCSNNDGCWEWYHLQVDDIGFGVQYDYGDQMYSNIQFAETDRTDVMEKTYVRQACSDINGCYTEDVVFIINDSDGNLLYEFSRDMWSQYGDKLPYKATLTLDDVETYYKSEGSYEPLLCQEASCTKEVVVYFENASGDRSHVANLPMKFSEGDKLIDMVVLDASTASPFETIDYRICQYKDGCVYTTLDYTVLDENGDEIIFNGDYINHLLYKFEYGEEMPYSDDFSVIYQLMDIVYRTRRVETYYIFNYMENFTMLDENMFYIKSPSWVAGEKNYILTYDEIEDSYLAAYTNLPYMQEICRIGDGYVGINNDETAIYYFELDTELSDVNYYHYNLTNLTENQEINAVNNLIIDYDGSIYFEAVDNFIQEITGRIAEDGTITIDTVYTEYEIVRVRPIN